MKQTTVIINNINKPTSLFSKINEIRTGHNYYNKQLTKIHQLYSVYGLLEHTDTQFTATLLTCCYNQTKHGRRYDTTWARITGYITSNQYTILIKELISIIILE